MASMHARHETSRMPGYFPVESRRGMTPRDDSYPRRCLEKVAAFAALPFVTPP